MPKVHDKNFNVILISMVIVGILSWTLYFKDYHQQDTVDIKTFPMVIGDWTAEDMPLTDLEYKILETKNVFVRKYKNVDGFEIYLFIVYSQYNRKVSHPPEICYTGSGVTILGNVRDSVTVSTPPVKINVNSLDLELKDVQNIAFYWFKVGDTFTSNYWKQQILIAIKTILGQPASSALIRVSADVVDEEKERTREQLKGFVQLITPYLFKHLP